MKLFMKGAMSIYIVQPVMEYLLRVLPVWSFSLLILTDAEMADGGKMEVDDARNGTPD
jgi:hypothetical protein